MRLIRLLIAALLLSGCTTLDITESEQYFQVKGAEGKTTKYEIWYSCEAVF